MIPFGSFSSAAAPWLLSPLLLIGTLSSPPPLVAAPPTTGSSRSAASPAASPNSAAGVAAHDPGDDPGDYDPGAVDAEAAVQVLELEVVDPARRRQIPVRMWLPGASSPAPAAVVLFSHGLGGSRRTGEYLGTHWAARGYAAVLPQHPGSDDAIWKQVPAHQRRAALSRAASLVNAEARVLDIHAILDQLERWSAAEGHPLASRLDLSSVGMSGHSFGAMTTQTICGQTHRRSGHGQCDRRIDCAIAMSPSAPEGDRQTAFGSVRVPWMMMTGSNDHPPIGRMPPEVRRDVFNHMPKAIDRYELMLGGADHFAFTARDQPTEVPARDARHHKTILRVSTAFWDAYLRDEPAAKRWLQGMAVRSTLKAGDRWRVGVADH